MKKNLKKYLSYLVYGIISLFIILFLGSAIPVFNYDVMTVISGSMEPTLMLGSVVVIGPAEKYEVGDIITFRSGGEGMPPTTHRIEDVRVEAGEMIYITKGDANPTEDITEIREEDVMGKVFFNIPYLGYLVDFVKTPVGFGALVIIPATLLVGDEIRKIFQNIKQKNET